MQGGSTLNLNLNVGTSGSTVTVANLPPVNVQISSVAISSMPAMSANITNPYLVVGGTVNINAILQTPTVALANGTGVFVDGSVMAFFASAQPTFLTNVATTTISGQVQTSTHVVVDNEVTVATHTSVDNFPATQAVTGAFFQSVQPVSQSGTFAMNATSVNVATVTVSGTVSTLQVNVETTTVSGGVSLGTAVGKTAVLKTGSLVTTAVTANQVVSTYTVTAGKTFYMEYITASARLTVQSATASILGTFSFQVGGVNALTETNTNNTTEQVYPMTYFFAEPIPFTSGTGIAVVCTPASTTSMTWTANFGGYER